MKIWASGSLFGNDDWLIVGDWGTGIETLTGDCIALARATEVTAALGVWEPTRQARLCLWHGETGKLPPSPCTSVSRLCGAVVPFSFVLPFLSRVSSSIFLCVFLCFMALGSFIARF